MRDPNRPVTLAVIVGAHGVRGEVRVKLFGESVESFRGFRAFNGGALTLTGARPQKGLVIARFAEITDRNAAEAARGTELWVPRSALPPLGEGEFYHADVVGLPVVTDAGDPIGTVRAVENYGAGDILDIQRPEGKTFMVPILACAIEEERVVVDSAYLP